MQHRSTLTLRTYRVGDDDQQQDATTHTVEAAATDPYNVHKWPPCTCPQHQ